MSTFRHIFRKSSNCNRQGNVILPAIHINAEDIENLSGFFFVRGF